MKPRTLQGPTDILGAYVPGNTYVHRTHVGFKLLTLVLVAVAVGVLRAPGVSLGALLTALLISFVAGIKPRALWRMVRGFVLVLGVLFIFHVWFSGWTHAFTVVAGLFALILLASVMTATSSWDDLLETFTTLLRPLKVFGVNPETVALAMSLVMTTIPTLLTIFRQTQEAAWARGLQRDPRALVIPFVTRTVAHALALGDALAARGLADD